MSRNFQVGAALIGGLGIAAALGMTVVSAAQTTPQSPTCTAADAVSLAPMGASTVALGAYTGVAYYTVTDAGYQVVATVAAGEAGAPIRFVSTLADGQNATLSVPQALGSPALQVEFQRCGEALVVRAPLALPGEAMAIVE
ncbi:MAG TPA: hypothetical protein VGW38_09860 [Chloroflexota bacterium]|nr:hypothetical protein [Chloroflexota bacterium]